ncbi:MAG: hypothetical protein SCM11_03165 [Bacillota bacterium]|nr:hypothetical protein [Bacillota bacterium]
MNFCEKLRLLTHVFKISNSKLARAINVDASLVSRWKSGDRSISAHSHHVPAIATFFIRLDAYPYQKTYLDRLLASLMPNLKEHDEADLIHALANWLVSPDDIVLPGPPARPAIASDPSRIFDNISSWFSKTHPQTAEAQKINSVPARAGHTPGWSEKFLPGQTLSGEVHHGVSGKRQAVINMLLELLQLTEPCELLLISEEHMHWLTDDIRFTRLWARLLQQVIEKGHKINVIHIVSRRTQEISSIIEYWLPLHLSGQIASFYMPRYVDPAINQTLYIVRGRIVCIAQSTGDVRTQGLTIISRDIEMVTHYTRIYESVLQDCLPLLSVFTPRNCHMFQQDIASLSEKPGRLYHIRRQPDTIFLPPNLYAKLQQLICRQHPSFARNTDLAGWLRSRRTLSGGQSHPARTVYDMLPLSLLEDICQNGVTITSDCELFVNQSLHLDFAESAAWLEQIIMMLRTEEAYHLFLYQEPADAQPLLFSLCYYENQAALFAPARSEHPFIISLREANSLHTLGLFLDRFIARIPNSQRNREDVIERLESVVRRLRQ